MDRTSAMERSKTRMWLCTAAIPQDCKRVLMC